MRSAAIATIGLIAFLAACASGGGTGAPVAPARPAADRSDPAAALARRAADCRAAEAPVLRNHVQLTFADRFAKAGENYFSPDDRRIVFQAVERPKDGGAPSEFYAMYVADVVRDAGGRITGIDGMRRISPEGSANTCGWFHP